MIGVALRMLFQKKLRFASTVIGLSALFFLSVAQLGLLIGWCNTVAALIVHSDVDLWVMSRQTPAYDYGSEVPRVRVQQARSIPGVAWAEGMFMDWGMWQREDGRRTSIAIIGLDESSVGGPWQMVVGSVDVVNQPDGVIVDEAFLAALGVSGLGDEAEIYGRRVVVRGISRGVRTFTASPFVFMSIETARKCNQRYRSDEVTYALVRCAPQADREEVRRRLLAVVADEEVLTTEEFAKRTILYWMLETGAGITVVVTAILGFLVSAVVVSQTLYTVTQDYLTNYATLFALGFGRMKLASIVFVQSLALGSVALLLGGIIFFQVAELTANTTIPLETIPMATWGIPILFLASCVLASFLSLQSVLSVDPGQVFRV